MIVIIFVVLLLSATQALPRWEDFIDPHQLSGLLTDLDSFQGFGIDPDPSPCCLPKQWQGTVVTLTGLSGVGRKQFGVEGSDTKGDKGKVEASTMIVYVDEINKRIAGQYINGITKEELLSFILTFKYTNESGCIINVFNSTSQQCNTTNDKKALFKEQCIPKDAKFIGNMNVGPALGGLPANSFVYSVTEKDSTMLGNSLVTPDACLPVITHAVGNVRRRFAGFVHLDVDQVDDRSRPKPSPQIGYVTSSFFYNLQASISDPSVFTPPSYCTKPESNMIRASNTLRFEAVRNHIYKNLNIKNLFQN